MPKRKTSNQKAVMTPKSRVHIWVYTKDWEKLMRRTRAGPDGRVARGNPFSPSLFICDLLHEKLARKSRSDAP